MRHSDGQIDKTLIDGLEDLRFQDSSLSAHRFSHSVLCSVTHGSAHSSSFGVIPFVPNHVSDIDKGFGCGPEPTGGEPDSGYAQVQEMPQRNSFVGIEERAKTPRPPPRSRRSRGIEKSL
jgi:hypothetical protein